MYGIASIALSIAIQCASAWCRYVLMKTASERNACVILSKRKACLKHPPALRPKYSLHGIYDTYAAALSPERPVMTTVITHGIDIISAFFAASFQGRSERPSDTMAVAPEHSATSLYFHSVLPGLLFLTMLFYVRALLMSFLLANSPTSLFQEARSSRH